MSQNNVTISQGAVCNLQPPPSTASPSSVPYPAIPIATDLASALQALNAIRQILNAQQGAIPQNNQSLQPGTPGSQQQQPKPQPTDYKLTNQQVERVRIYNPNDSSQYVDVDQVVSLTWKNKAKQSISWTQQAPS